MTRWFGRTGKSAGSSLWWSAVWPYGDRRHYERAIAALPEPLHISIWIVVALLAVAELILWAAFSAWAAWWAAGVVWNATFGRVPALVWGILIVALPGFAGAGVVAPGWRRSYGTTGSARSLVRRDWRRLTAITAAAAWAFFEFAARGGRPPEIWHALRGLLALFSLDMAAAAVTGFSLIESVFRASGARGWAKWQARKEADNALRRVKDGERRLREARCPPSPTGDFRDPGVPAPAWKIVRLEREVSLLKKLANRAHLHAGRLAVALPFPDTKGPDG